MGRSERGKGVKRERGRSGICWPRGNARRFAFLPLLLSSFLPLTSPTWAQGTTARSTPTDPVLEALREQRIRARAAEVLRELPPGAVVFGPMEVPGADPNARRQMSPSLPSVKPFAVPLPPLRVQPERPEPEPPPPMALREPAEWVRVRPGDDEAAFIERFREALWGSASRYTRTPIDTMATPAVRAHLHSAFGPPTRSPVARSRPEMGNGSAFVQFEYWFVVNDTIPVVVMDKNGPFGRGVVLVSDEAFAPVLADVERSLAEVLLRQPRLMPYVDYFQHREKERWYRTGFDGEAYYTVETPRPRWARDTDERGLWYDFR